MMELSLLQMAPKAVSLLHRSHHYNLALWLQQILLVASLMKYMLTLNFPMTDISYLNVSTDALHRNVSMILAMTVQ